jgi:hypothetical protein
MTLKHAVLAAAAGLVLSAGGSAALAQKAKVAKIKGTYAIATLRPGTSFNATAAGIARLINKHSGARIRLRETGAFLEEIVGRKETPLGLNSSPNAYDAYMGRNLYKGRAIKNLRNIVLGPILFGSLMAKKSSGMKFVGDLKGKRVPGKFSGAPVFLDDIKVLLSTAGLTYKDLKEVPVSGIRENYQAFMNGLTDVANASLGSGVVNQADAKHGGVRFLSLPDRPDLAKLMAEVKPGFYPYKHKKGAYTGIVEDTTTWAKDIMLNCHTEVQDELAYQIARILWEHVRELDGSHPAMPTWTKKSMVSDRNTVPIHNGAVKFFKDIGKWTPEREARQKALLAGKG